MRIYILEKLTADTPLAALFNAYLSGLSTLDICTIPLESLRACREAFAAEARGEAAPLSITAQARRYYELTALSNALNGLHWCVEQAHELLTEFFTEHGGDLLAYAQANRRQLLTEYGGGEDEDWQRVGPGDAGPDDAGPDDAGPDDAGPDDTGEGWEVTDTADPARLADYTLHRELSRFFPDADEHGERIGSSDPADFAPYTAAVEHQTDFSLRKMFRDVAGKEIAICRQDESGQFVPIPVIDQLEQEINEDVTNAALVGRFNAVLNASAALAELHATMPPDERRGYELLHECLSNMLAVDMEAYPPF